jgi:Holliday junction resolvasome RuvABC endonuclease subunit
VSSLRICAVDPGATGGICFLDPLTWDVELHDMPTTVVVGTKARTIVDRLALARLLTPSAHTRQIAVVEKVHAMPNDGAVQAFAFGMGYGALLLACDAHGYELHEPTPSVWKKHFGLTGHKNLTQAQIKNMSRSLAQKRLPAIEPMTRLAKHHNRAEAALLALYGVEKILPKLGITLATPA